MKADDDLDPLARVFLSFESSQVSGLPRRFLQRELADTPDCPEHPVPDVWSEDGTRLFLCCDLRASLLRNQIGAPEGSDYL